MPGALELHVIDLTQMLAGPLCAMTQIAQRRMVETVQHPKAGAVQTLGIPIKLSHTPGSIRMPAPLLGQHTAAILPERKKP